MFELILKIVLTIGVLETGFRLSGWFDWMYKGDQKWENADKLSRKLNISPLVVPYNLLRTKYFSHEKNWHFFIHSTMVFMVLTNFYLLTAFVFNLTGMWIVFIGYILRVHSEDDIYYKLQIRHTGLGMKETLKFLLGPKDGVIGKYIRPILVWMFGEEAKRERVKKVILIQKIISTLVIISFFLFLEVAK